jgi:hypothetical protein
MGATPDDPESNIISTGLGIPGALMYGSLVDQDISCRAIGRCSHGDPIDRELGDMIPRGPDGRAIPLDVDTGRSFLYARYNVDLTREGLERLGFGDVEPRQVQKMDNATPENIERLLAIGTAAGAAVRAEHFGLFAA